MTLARIIQDTWQGTSPPVGLAERNTMNSELETMARDAGLEAQVRCHGAASIGRGLHELAEAEQADLLVVGSSHRGSVDRVVLGDDTRDALDGAPCAVAIAPAGYALERRPIRRIGVGYDRSPESKHALRVARVLAGERGAALAALEAVSIPSYALGVGPVPVAAGCDHSSSRLISDCRGCPMSNPTRSTVTRPKHWPRSAHRWT